jgi:hypothetical protein
MIWGLTGTCFRTSFKITRIYFLSGRRDTLKKTRLIVIVVTATMLSSLLAGLTFAKNENNPFAQIWNAVFVLQSRVDEIEASSTTRYVIEGVIDLAEDGDVISPSSELSNVMFHWKTVSVPQLTLDDMPLINVYLKPPSGEFMDPFDMWRDNGEDWGYYYLKAVYDEQTIYICYKRVDSSETTYFINGEYMIVVVK